MIDRITRRSEQIAGQKAANKISSLLMTSWLKKLICMRFPRILIFHPVDDMIRPVTENKTTQAETY
jgi:hypothetical protein